MDSTMDTSLHAPHTTSLHLWNGASRKALLQYYSFNGYYICPNCKEMTKNDQEFQLKHKYARGFTDVSKRDLFNDINKMNKFDMMPDISATFEQYGSGRPATISTNVQRDGFNIRTIKSLDQSCISIEFIPQDVILSASDFVQQNRELILESVLQHAPVNHKIQFCCEAQFTQPTDDTQSKSWHVSVAAEKPQDNHYGFLVSKARTLDEMLSKYSEISSGWTLSSISKISLRCTEFNELCRLSGHSYIPTPPFIAKKKCCINVINEQDNNCFLYAILSLLKYDDIKKHHERCAKYEKYLAELNFKESDMPMKICNISKFERNNPHLAINVIKYTPLTSVDFETRIDYFNQSDLVCFSHPCFELIYRSRWYIPKYHKEDVKVLHLVLIEDGDNFHYLGVRNINKLLNCHSNVEGCSDQIKGNVCDTCLRIFRYKSTLEKHKSICLKMKINGTVYTLPEEKELYFKDWQKSIPPKFIAYADFESMLIPNEPSEDFNNSIVQTHKPIASAFLLINPDDNQAYEEFFGEDCIVQFLKRLEEHSKSILQWYEKYSHQPVRDLATEELQNFMKANKCYLCQQFFTQKNNKVLDHDHFNGEYLGAACNKCNLARRIRKPFLPVAFHNLRGYDMHHIMKYAISKFQNWSLQCIPQSSEKFQALICYIKNGVPIRFIDTLQFLPTSLNNLACMLNSEQKVFTNAISDLPQAAKDGKGIFPYSYIKSKEVLEEKRDNLPPIQDAFFDYLENDVVISDDDYSRAQFIWNETKCTSLKDYMMQYLKVDVHILADVFETFRKTAIEEDRLDPANFFSIPGLSWCAALHSMPYRLDLIQDHEMYEFFESGIRGGMTFVNKHYSHQSENVELLYIDINNLYGWALSQKLPYKDFKWNHNPNKNYILKNLPDENSEIGYVLEVDMHIPDNIHDKLADLPPAPEMKTPPNGSVPKLLLTLEDKKNYVIHSALLKFYVEKMGVIVEHIHRMVEFKQTDVFKGYIDKNTTMRALSSSKFKKDYYKLKNNSLYGKTVENLRRRKDLRLCTTRKSFVTYASRPLYKKCIQVDEDLVIAMLTKETICLNRPVYIGQAVLDLSKLRMYRLQYEDLEQYRYLYCNSQINILAGDTDSFFLQVKNISLKNQLLPKMIEDGLLDTSNYESTSSLYSNKHENKIGLFKDESCGNKHFLEWIFLRPKCYSLLSDKSEHQKAKGILRSTQLSHGQYLEVYQSYHPESNDATSPKRMRVEQCSIQSKKHQLYTLRYTRQALTIMDDKRVWVNQNCSVPYGHYSVRDAN